MSAHDWPSFDEFRNMLRPAGKGYALINEAQYNYAKVRIDGYEALQQRCEELVADLITYSCHKPDCNLVAVKSMRCVCTCGLDKAIAKQVQPCNTPTK